MTSTDTSNFWMLALHSASPTKVSGDAYMHIFQCHSVDMNLAGKEQAMEFDK